MGGVFTFLLPFVEVSSAKTRWALPEDVGGSGDVICLVIYTKARLFYETAISKGVGRLQRLRGPFTPRERTPPRGRRSGDRNRHC